jgi:carbonic anhydrase
LTDDLSHLFANNRAWVERVTREDPGFFERLRNQQRPELLWIGCSDSRVPANQITGLLPGDVFVHRNLANLVVHTDLNCLSVVQFAVDVLKVRHIIVCGHYGCGGVLAALTDQRLGLVDNWLRHLTDVRTRNAGELEALTDVDARWRRLSELNVLAQVDNLATTTVVKDARHRGEQLRLHGWIYDVADGLLHDLHGDRSSRSS